MQIDKVCMIMLKTFLPDILPNRTRQEKPSEKNTLLMCIIHVRLSKEYFQKEVMSKHKMKNQIVLSISNDEMTKTRPNHIVLPEISKSMLRARLNQSMKNYLKFSKLSSIN